jgi:sec-independent protein translocase protein TatC
MTQSKEAPKRLPARIPKNLSMTNSVRPESVTESQSNSPIIAPAEEPAGAMTFFEHLNELRKRIVYSLYAIGIGAFVGVYVSKYVINFIIRPIIKALTDAHLNAELVYTHPAGYLNTYITLGVYIGIVLASPVVLYQVWLFVAPALYKHERSAVTGFIFSTVFLFLAGIAFGYFVTLPYILRFLVSFQGPVSSIKPMITVNEYFDLVLLVLLGLGLVFELPILIFFLSLFGIVTPKFLWKNFRYAILIIAIVAAVVTPTPDAMTMLIFMAPMVGLYFVGIAVSAVVTRRRERRLAAPAEAR